MIPERVRKISMFADNKVYVDAFEWSDGSVSIETQDLRGEEHEHFVTVRKPSVPLIRAALHAAPEDDLLDLLRRHGSEIVRRGEMQWLADNGIRFTYSCYP